MESLPILIIYCDVISLNIRVICEFVYII